MWFVENALTENGLENYGVRTQSAKRPIRVFACEMGARDMGIEELTLKRLTGILIAQGAHVLPLNFRRSHSIAASTVLTINGLVSKAHRCKLQDGRTLEGATSNMEHLHRCTAVESTSSDSGRPHKGT